MEKSDSRITDFILSSSVSVFARFTIDVTSRIVTK
jgi:hypothetical protein